MFTIQKTDKWVLDILGIVHSTVDFVCNHEKTLKIWDSTVRSRVQLVQIGLLGY